MRHRATTTPTSTGKLLLLLLLMDEDKSLLSMGVDHDPPLTRGGAAYAPYACATVPASGHEESEEVAIEPAPLLETQPLLPSPSPLDLARTDADIPADILDAFPRETTVARVPGLRLPPALGHMTSRQPMETASTSSTPTAPPATFDITPSHIRWHHTYPHQNHHPIPCWPFTSLGRRVACPAALRVTDQQDRDVPAAHHACSLWWLSWVFAGGDPASLANDSNDYALLAQRFHWQLPPVGCQRPWSPSEYVFCVCLQHCIQHAASLQSNSSRACLPSPPKNDQLCVEQAAATT